MIKILELLKDKAIDNADFLSAILASGYGASMSKIEYKYKKYQRVSQEQKKQLKDLMAKRERLQKFLSKLKHDGLINETSDQNSKFYISSKGKAKLTQLKNKLPEKHYKTQTQDQPVIISFDIPEKLRKKRSWLREALKNLGFEMVHQSVWVGKIKIPKQFILDLGEMDILEYIEIFEINKTGSLNRIEKS